MWTTSTTITETGAISFNSVINSTSYSALASTGSQYGSWTNTSQLYSLSSRRVSSTFELRRLMSLRKWLHLHYIYVEQIQYNGLILLIPSYWRTRSQSVISSFWWKLAHSITKPSVQGGNLLALTERVRVSISAFATTKLADFHHRRLREPESLKTKIYVNSNSTSLESS